MRTFADSDAARADIVVAFDEAAQLPALSKARNWVLPSWNDDYDAARAALAPKIESLIDEVSRRPCSQ